MSLSEIAILACSAVQIGGLVAIFDMIRHNRGNKYRGWVYLIAGFAPLFKIPFLENCLFIDWAAFAAGFVLLFMGMNKLFAANAEHQYLTVVSEPTEDGSDRVIDLD